MPNGTPSAAPDPAGSGAWHRIDSAWYSLSPPSDSYKPIQINDLIVSMGFLSLFGDETGFPATPEFFANQLK